MNTRSTPPAQLANRIYDPSVATCPFPPTRKEAKQHCWLGGTRPNPAHKFCRLCGPTFFGVNAGG
jgi:hypothetical protein